ncbi:MAG: efflux RND transporter periplasmic adaptor subunit [Acidobacteria bacterium]|nr:efflux RND transporter periplasmic adaptor subunit [Acidobacteriota bacterium]
MKAFGILLLIAAAFAGGYFFRERRGESPKQESGRKILYWYDSMHPAYRSDKPGIAPDCGMQLTPKYADEETKAVDPSRKVAFYRDPAQPEYKSDKPGLNPETGNELVAVYEGDLAALAKGSVQIGKDQQQLVGVKTGLVEITSDGRAIQAAGKVTVDENRIAHVHTRTEGFVEHIHVHVTGAQVKEGDPLVTIYSPELLATQQEFLLALRAQRETARSPLEGTQDRMGSLVEAARRRLDRWSFTAEQMAEITRTGKPVERITLHAPVSGFVTERKAFDRMKVTPEMELYTIVDLSRVWILAEVFESDVPNVKVGTGASVRLPAMPGRTLAGRVSYINPSVDPETRTLKARIEVANPGVLLKPEMFVDVEFRTGAAARITVPVDAVLDAGDRKTVFVDRGNGMFEPRRVQTGERFGDRVVVLSGLQAGERIVTSGTFLLDSESQMKGTGR